MLNDKQRSELSYIAFCKYEIFKRKTLKHWGKHILKDFMDIPKYIYEIITGTLYMIANLLMFIFFPVGLFISWVTLKLYIKRRDK